MDAHSHGDPIDFLDLTAHIVSAYVGNNSLASTDLTELIGSVHSALKRLTVGEPSPVAEVLKPAVPVRKSVTPDYIICLEDGRQFKSLKRHLRTAYDLSPAQYREKWDLPHDYPMVAPNYAAARSNLAKSIGLGQARAKAAAVAPSPVEAAKPGRGKRKAKVA